MNWEEARNYCKVQHEPQFYSQKEAKKHEAGTCENIAQVVILHCYGTRVELHNYTVVRLKTDTENRASKQQIRVWVVMNTFIVLLQFCV